MPRIDMDWLISEVERLHDALEDYGMHKPACKVWQIASMSDWAGNCTCGLWDILKGSK